MPKVIDTGRLFRAVVQVFAERGYGPATTQEIARRAGVNEVTLFRRHANKATLIGEALAHCLADSPFGRLEASDDVEADLTEIVRAYAETFESYGGAVLTLLTEIPRHPALKKATAALMPNLMNAASIIASHQRARRIAAGDPLQKLAFLIAPTMASGLWRRTGMKMAATKLDSAQVARWFLAGHASQG